MEMQNKSIYLSDLFYRSFELERSAVNKDERSVDLAFSSETPVERWFGKEILLHGVKNVDLTRLKTMGSALMNHDPGFILGRISSPRIEDKRGKATLIFDDDDDGNKAMSKVESGSLRGVSMGYMVQKFREVQENETYNGIEGPAYIATLWTPYEISLTPIPADATVGVGRDLTRSLDGIDIVRSGSYKKQPNDGQQEGQQNETHEYLELLGKAGAIGTEAKMLVVEMCGEGRSYNEISSALIALATTSPDAANRGQLGDGRVARLPAPKGNEPSPVIISFDQIDDDEFIRGLTNPSLFL